MSGTKKRRVKTRDWALVRLIQGATKANVQVDRRKEANRKACRGRARGSHDE